MPINSPHYRWNELNGKQRAELDAQIVELTDAFLDDIADLDRGRPFDETRLAKYLPRQFLAHYHPAFAKRFLVAFLTVTWKLKDPSGVHVCANQAEELALYALIQATQRMRFRLRSTTSARSRRRSTRTAISYSCSTRPWMVLRRR